MKFDENDKSRVRNYNWIVVFAMFIYGGAKIFQFDGAS
jgi:hypothetical protein